jgi:hypothetical protein
MACADGPTNEEAMRAALVLLTAGEGLEPYRHCLDALLAHTPAEVAELRLGFANAPVRLHYALGRLAADFRAPEHADLPGGVERFRWTSPEQIPVCAWSDARAPSAASLLPVVCGDMPVTAKYLVWLRDDTPVAEGWWQGLESLLKEGVDCAGTAAWAEYRPGLVEHVRARPWFRGVPLSAREGKPGVSYLRAPLVLRTARIGEIDLAALPALASVWGDEPEGVERLLGEMTHQLGWSREEARARTGE